VKYHSLLFIAKKQLANIVNRGAGNEFHVAGGEPGGMQNGFAIAGDTMSGHHLVMSTSSGNFRFCPSLLPVFHKVRNQSKYVACLLQPYRKKCPIR